MIQSTCSSSSSSNPRSPHNNNNPNPPFPSSTSSSSSPNEYYNNHDDLHHHNNSYNQQHDHQPQLTPSISIRNCNHNNSRSSLMKRVIRYFLPYSYYSYSPHNNPNHHHHHHSHNNYKNNNKLAPTTTTMLIKTPTISNIAKLVIALIILYKLVLFVCYFSFSGSSYSNNNDNCCGGGDEEGERLQLGSSSKLLKSEDDGVVGGGNSRKRTLPSVLIIGARKCGTRALIDMLNLHPQVEKAQLEVHFFDRDENYEKGLEWYESQMPELNPESQISIEKSPSYFVTPEVPERVYGMNSTIKLLLIVREPVTRVISDYTQIYYYSNSSSSSSSGSSSASNSGTNNNNNNNNPSSTLLTTTAAAAATSMLLNNSQQPSNNNNIKNPAPVPIATNPQPPPPPLSTLILHPDGSINTNYKAIRISIYSRYLQRWLDIFPTSQIHVIDGDALIRDPFTQLQDVEKFLNIQAKLKREDFYFNSTKGFYCWKKHEVQMQNQHNDSVSSSLPSQQQPNNNNSNNYNTVHCLNDSKGRKHPNVDRRIVRKLREFYKPFNQRFYEMVGRDFGWPES